MNFQIDFEIIGVYSEEFALFQVDLIRMDRIKKDLIGSNKIRDDRINYYNDWRALEIKE